MSVNDEDKYPWLVPEKKLVREVIESGKPVLGIFDGLLEDFDALHLHRGRAASGGRSLELFGEVAVVEFADSILS